MRNRHHYLADALLSVLSGTLALVLAVIALRITPDELGQRWSVGGADQVLHYGIFSSALNTFPFFGNPHLGFPAAQNLFFAPLFDLWSALFVSTIGALGLAPDGVWALNIYNMAGFAAVGVTAFVFFRALRLRRATSLVFGVLFAIAPYHFDQLGKGHPFLAAYWAVPLIGVLVLMVGGRSTDPFGRFISRATSRRQRLVRRLLPIILISVAVAFTQSYYFVFAALIVGGVWVLRLLFELAGRGLTRTGWHKTLLWPSVTVGVLALTIGGELLVLSLNFNDRYEKYFQGRSVLESEVYGGKLIDLVMPSMLSGFTPLAKLSQLYHSASLLLPTSEPAATAIVAALGITLALVLVMIRVAGRVPHSVGVAGLRRFVRLFADPRLPVMLAATLWAVLFFLAGGLGAVIALLSPEIRSWSRMSIVVSLFGLAVLAITIERLCTRRTVLAFTLAVVSVIGLVDEVPGVAADVPLNPVSDTDIRSFVSDAESILPQNCGIAMLPTKGFPETGPIGDMGDYDEALPYVYAEGDDLRFSYGAVDGTRDADIWRTATTPESFAAATSASGACAIIVDKTAYTSAAGAPSPSDWRARVAAAGADPDRPELTSGDTKRYLLFRVTPVTPHPLPASTLPHSGAAER